MTIYDGWTIFLIGLILGIHPMSMTATGSNNPCRKFNNYAETGQFLTRTLPRKWINDGQHDSDFPILVCNGIENSATGKLAMDILDEFRHSEKEWTVFFHNCDTDSLPNGFIESIDVSQMSFNDVKIKELPYRLINSARNSLRTLSCMSCDVGNKAITSDKFLQNDQMRLLYFEMTNIERLDRDAFSAFANLEELHLRYSKLQRLDKHAFRGLTKLTVLELTHNEIQSLDKDVFRGLTNLKFLNLYKNEIESLEKETFLDLTQLTSLVIAENKIQILEKDTFRGLKELNYLMLANNKIQRLDKDTFRDSSKLTQLYLYGNQIRRLDKGVFQSLTKLNQLELNHNVIQSVDKDAFGGLTNLTHLYLFNNEITSLDKDAFCDLTNLTSLYLSNNEIESLDKDVFRELISLQSLDISNNKLKKLDDGIFDSLNRNIYISLKGNELHCDCDLQWLQDWLQNNRNWHQITCHTPMKGQLKTLKFCGICRPISKTKTVQSRDCPLKQVVGLNILRQSGEASLDDQIQHYLELLDIENLCDPDKCPFKQPFGTGESTTYFYDLP